MVTHITFKRETRNYKEEPRKKIRKYSFAETKAQLKALKNRMNNNTRNK